MVSVMLEAIASGLTVSVLSKYLINNNFLFGCCQNLFYEPPIIEHDDNASSATTTTNETEITHQIHSHVY